MRIYLDGEFCYRKAPWLTWKDIEDGVSKGYIASIEAIVYASEALKENSPQLHYELAILTENDASEVEIILPKLATEPYGSTEQTKNTENTENTENTWVYLALTWLYERKNTIDRPFQVIEEVYADFNYPEVISPLVGYMPPTDCSIYTNASSLLDRWEILLSTLSSELENQRNQLHTLY